MKLAVLGATGGTGLEVVKYALEQGHEVRALARTPSKIEDVIQHEKLTVVQGDALSTESIQDAIHGVDAVLSALGTGGFFQAIKPTTFYSDSGTCILQAMKKEGVKRLIVVTSSGVEHDDGAPFFYRAFLRKLLMPLYVDMNKLEDMVQDESSSSSSSIEWTIVRPSYLENCKSKECRVNDRFCAENGWKIGRIDTAKFMVKEAEEPQWVGKHPALAC